MLTEISPNPGTEPWRSKKFLCWVTVCKFLYLRSGRLPLKVSHFIHQLPRIATEHLECSIVDEVSKCSERRGVLLLPVPGESAPDDERASADQKGSIRRWQLEFCEDALSGCARNWNVEDQSRDVGKQLLLRYVDADDLVGSVPVGAQAVNQ
jgi:hypothetical protein